MLLESLNTSLNFETSCLICKQLVEFINKVERCKQRLFVEFCSNSEYELHSYS